MPDNSHDPYRHVRRKRFGSKRKSFEELVASLEAQIPEGRTYLREDVERAVYDLVSGLFPEEVQL